MSRVRNAMTSALGGASAAQAAGSTDRGEETPASGEAFQELMRVEGQNGERRNPQAASDGELSRVDEGDDTDSRSVVREERVATRHRGADAILDGLTRSRRCPDDTTQRGIAGRLERAPGGAGAASVRAPAGAPTGGSPAATGGPGSAPPGAGTAAGTHPDSFAESIKTGAFRGQTSEGTKGIRAWVQAWQTTEAPGGGAEPGSAGIPSGTPGATPALRSLGDYLKGLGRVRGGQTATGQPAARPHTGRNGRSMPAGAMTAATASEPDKGAGPRSWFATLRTPQQVAGAPAGGESAPVTQAPAAPAAIPDGITPVAGPAVTPGGVGTTVGGAPASAASPTAASVASPGNGFTLADPAAEANGVRIRVPTSAGETVRGRMYMDADSRSVRVVLAVQEGNTAQSMSSAHELLRARLADEGYQLQSFVVRHDGRAVVRFEDEVQAQLAGDGGRDADQADPKDEAEMRSRMGRGRTGPGTAAAAAAPEETVASGWFL